MSDYMVLMGADDVRSAGNAMSPMSRRREDSMTITDRERRELAHRIHMALVDRYGMMPCSTGDTIKSVIRDYRDERNAGMISHPEDGYRPGSIDIL
jgi:hypothetical protein